MTTRRDFIRASLVGTAALAFTRDARALGPPQARTAPTRITVYKSPTCGCCKLWIDHVEKFEFAATVHDMSDLSEIKKTAGIAPDLQSCHTSLVGAYWFEGHVPGDLVRKVVDEKPAIAGLAVPGMPQGSPGMETGRKDPYDVMAVERDGRRRVFAKR